MILSQDVAVDGWALTMLKPKNVGYASTCNSVGQVESLKNSSVFKKILCFSTSLLWWSKAIFSHVYCSKKFLRSKLFFMANLFPKFAMSYFHQQTWDKKIFIGIDTEYLHRLADGAWVTSCSPLSRVLATSHSPRYWCFFFFIFCNTNYFCCFLSNSIGLYKHQNSLTNIFSSSSSGE